MRSIMWKLILVTFLLVSIPIYFLNRNSISSFDEFTRTALEEEMISQAYMLGEQYRAMNLNSRDGNRDMLEQEFELSLKKYSDKLDSRLQILSSEGIVLFDSDPDSLVGSDMSGRKEVMNAMRDGGYKANWRISKQLNRVFYYVPLTIKEGDEVIGVSYVIRHTGQITKAIMAMKAQRVNMYIVLTLAALAAAVVFAYTITYRLRKLTRAAIAYARGEEQLELKIGGKDEIGELSSAVDYMATEIEKRNSYNMEFLSTVMHELRTPVTAIKGAAEVLETGAFEKKEARSKFLSNITYEADRLTRMIGELNEVTKLDVESLRGQKQRVDYSQCVKEILGRLMPTFDQDHAEFDALLPDEALETMIVPGRIEQVISNLLENAFRYTPVSGKVRLQVELKDKDTVLTTLTDTGPGIPEGSAEKVFDRFYTTEHKDVPKEYGSGLGLAIAKSIVENHQGTIWVDSSVSEGASFAFTLPLA